MATKATKGEDEQDEQEPDAPATREDAPANFYPEPATKVEKDEGFTVKANKEANDKGYFGTPNEPLDDTDLTVTAKP